MDQDETWHGGRPRPRPHCGRWGPNPNPKKRAQQPPQFLAHVCCGQTAGWIKMPLRREVDLGPGDTVLDGDPAPQGAPPILVVVVIVPVAVVVSAVVGAATTAVTNIIIIVIEHTLLENS